MSRTISLTLAVFASFLFFSPANGIEKSHGNLDLPTAIQLSIDQSPKVQKSKAHLTEAEWKTRETYQGFLPSVNMQAGHLLNKQYEFLDVVLNNNPITFPQIFPTTYWQVNANLPLFEGFQSYNTYRAARLYEQAASDQYELAKFQLVQDVRLKFYQALAAQKLKAVADQNVTTLNDHFEQTRMLRKGGVATSYDVLRVEVQLNEAKSEVLKAEDDLDVTRRRLIQSIGLDEDERTPIGDLPTPDEKMAVDLKWEPEKNLDLKSTSEAAVAADRLDSAASTYWVPRISLGAQWISYNNRTDDINDTSAYRWAYNIGIYLNWNLFDGMASIARSQEALQERVQAEKTLHLTRQQSSVDFDYWKRRYSYNTSLYRAKLTEVEKSLESVRLAKEAFRAGARTSSEVLDAELDLFRARAGVVNAEMSSAEALINLQLAVGHEIK